MSLVPTSLTGRLVATMVALVALVALLISGTTTWAMRSYLTGRLDAQVSSALGRAVHDYVGGASPNGPRTRPSPHIDGDGDGDGSPVLGEAPGQGAGTLTAAFDEYGDRGNVLTEAGQFHNLYPSALDALRDVPSDGHAHAVELPGLGSYRVQAVATRGGSVVSGLSTRDIDATLGSLLEWEALLTLLGVGVAGAAGRWLVRRQLRPLRQVAETANEVATLPLSSGAIGTTVRVPDQLADGRTEVGQVGVALNTMLAHVEEALDQRHRSEQQVRQFVADASHELRTPLSTIHGYAELSRRTTPPDPEQLAQAMSKVEAEATRMSSLVEDLLLLARLDTGRPLAKLDVDLTKLALEAVEDARVICPDHRWQLDLPGEPVVAPGDEQRLHQLLTNLLNNARRHTPAGTSVITAVRQDGDHAVLSVQDDGPGMPADLVHRAFERFTRGDAARTRRAGGAGLGLSLVQAICVAHGGTVAVDSAKGRTRLEVRLPLPTRAPQSARSATEISRR